MKTYTSFQELDALGEGLAKKYTGNTHRWNSSCFDIEGFITDFLKLPILYEAFAENDPSKIGFLSDGATPLIVYRGGKKTPVVFPKDTIVIERYLQCSDESGRRRFTLAHEAAHFILNRHVPMQTACFHNDYDREFNYSGEELAKMFSLNESLTNRLGAAVLLPLFLVARALKKYNNGQPIVYYTEGVFAPDTKIKLQSMSDALGVSYSALINRLRELKLLDCRPIEEYIDHSLFPEGSI